jgi:hypothetical protein
MHPTERNKASIVVTVLKKRTNLGYLRNHTLTQISAGKRKVAYHHKYIPENEASGRERIDGPLW